MRCLLFHATPPSPSFRRIATLAHSSRRAHYGSYKDWFRLADLARDVGKTPEQEVRLAMARIADKIFDLVADQLLKDRDALNAASSADKGGKQAGVSLLAKWALREKRSFRDQVRALARRIFPDSPTPKKDYRKLVSELNRAINTVEVKMSSNQWDRIDFGFEVPSVCMMKCRKAFLNEKVKGPPPQTAKEQETGNRHPDDPARVASRKRLRDAMTDSRVQKLKGRQLFPHEVVQKFMDGGGRLSTLEKDVFECQWKDIRSSVMEAMAKVREAAGDSEEGKSSAVDLGKLVPLVDVSGSMSGVPMQVAVSLGLLVGELASAAFANRMLTFSARPDWVSFGPEMPLEEKVRKAMRAPWNMNTDFEAATEKILEVAVRAKLKPDDIPNLIVFSDMQFDQARSQWHYSYSSCGGEAPSPPSSRETHHERVVRRFAEAGLSACGEEWPAPQIIYWNLRGDTQGFPAQADTPGVTMLSGFSPALMKLLLSGEALEEEEEVEEEEGVVVVTKKKVKKVKDPYAALRAALDDTEYDRVREVLYSPTEGALKDFAMPAAETSGGAEDTKPVEDGWVEDEWVAASR